MNPYVLSHMCVHLPMKILGQPEPFLPPQLGRLKKRTNFKLLFRPCEWGMLMIHFLRLLTTGFIPQNVCFCLESIATPKHI